MKAVRLLFAVPDNVLPGAYVVAYVNDSGDVDGDYRPISGRVPARKPQETIVYAKVTPAKSAAAKGGWIRAGAKQGRAKITPAKIGETLVPILTGSFYGGKGDGITRLQGKIFDRAGQVSGDDPDTIEVTISTFPRTGRNLRVQSFQSNILTMRCDASPDL